MKLLKRIPNKREPLRQLSGTDISYSDRTFCKSVEMSAPLMAFNKSDLYWGEEDLVTAPPPPGQGMIKQRQHWFHECIARLESRKRICIARRGNCLFVQYCHHHHQQLASKQRSSLHCKVNHYVHCDSAQPEDNLGDQLQK